MFSLTDVARELAAFGESGTPNQTSHMRAAAHALRDMELRLQAMEAILAAVAKRAGLSAADMAPPARTGPLKEHLRRILG